MSKADELKKEAEEWIAKNSKEFITNPNYSPFDYAEAIYLASAEPREKRIAELEKDKAYAEEQLDEQIQATLDLQKQVKDLEWQLQKIAKDNENYQKENAELKENNEKWFVFETEAGNWGMDKATQYTVDRHNYFYGTKEECQKWGVSHKIKDYTGHKYCYDRLDDQLAQAKEIIKNILRVTWGEGWNYSLDWKVKAEQFLNGENIILEDVQTGNSPFDADEVFNKEMKAYPEEKVKKEIEK